MFFEYSATFNLIEWLSIMGLLQTIFILVYIIMRIRRWRQGVVAVCYLLLLALCFALQFALRLDDFYSELRHTLIFCRAMLPPLCFLLVMQVVLMNELPEKKHFWVLIFAPIFLSAERFFSLEMLYWLSAMTGTVSMLAIWCSRDALNILRKMKGGRERYWLIIMLVVANLLGVVVTLLRSIGYIAVIDADAMMVLLGIAFCYLATSTLLRVYPQPVQLDSVPRTTGMSLSTEEKAVAERVKQLMELDKLYHEPTFGRADLAREIGVSESILSRVINIAFGKSFPTLISYYRVEDAKRMLADSDIPVQVVAKEVGFNSLASFNRVFRQLAGEAPTSFRVRNRLN